jgi:hypothetical protein
LLLLMLLLLRHNVLGGLLTTMNPEPSKQLIKILCGVKSMVRSDLGKHSQLPDAPGRV